MKELLGYTVREIAAVLDLSEPRIYQLVARAKAIGREYRQKNG
jgi:DNA-directed RNA polymerase specialized sigma24 family protein